MMCCHAQWFFVVVCLKLWIRFIWFDKKWADVMLLLMHFVDVHRLCRPILFFEPIFFFLSSCMLLFFICCCFSSASNKSLNSLFVCVCIFLDFFLLIRSAFVNLSKINRAHVWFILQYTIGTEQTVTCAVYSSTCLKYSKHSSNVNNTE